MYINILTHKDMPHLDAYHIDYFQQVEIVDQ